jgi:Ca2+-binding EF-hand superfamily protein
MKIFYVIGLVFFIIIHAVSLVHSDGPSDEMIRSAFKQILAEADKNKDGKLQMAECKTIFKDKKKGEADCGFWDANHDGIITEEEYVSQVKSLRKKK